MQERNNELNKLRKIPIKTLEQQKKFIELKEGKLVGKQTITLKKIGSMLLYLFVFIVLLRGYVFVFNYFNVVISFFWLVVFIIVGPICINLLLKKFNVETDDITVFFKRSK